jgi:hypothetical protein
MFCNFQAHFLWLQAAFFFIAPFAVRVSNSNNITLNKKSPLKNYVTMKINVFNNNQIKL